jgi:hypothetical protein
VTDAGMSAEEGEQRGATSPPRPWELGGLR